MESNSRVFDYQAFGSRLKDARERAGFTQAQACEAVGIQKAQVLSSYERGISNPPIDILAELARLYGVSLDDLVFADEKPEKIFTTGDWLFSLVRAVDRLIIIPTPSSERDIDNLKYNATAELCWGKNGVYYDFFNKWIKLRGAWIDKLIDTNDYYHLVRRHANQVPNDPEYKNYQTRYEELDRKYRKDYKCTDSKPSETRSVLSRLISLISRNSSE